MDERREDRTSAPHSPARVSPGQGAGSCVPETEDTCAPGREAPTIPPVRGEAELDDLRRLLFGRETALLEQLQKRLDDPARHARDVSDVIAEALILRAGRDDRLRRSLEPVVEKILKSALRKSPADFTAALFPLMGPSIRRSIAEAFRGMLQGFNKSMEMAFSWQGLRWRLEALRTGKPFSEVVLLHTLLYRVEQIFFIHSDTGLVLAHVSGEGVESQDADMVSAMLTAIQDFVRDCFARGNQGELESLRLGDFTILVEKSPLAYLACVVRGSPPAGFRERLCAALDLMLIECAEPLASFSGDTAPFGLARRHLQDCLESRFIGEDKPLPLWVKVLPVLVPMLVIGGLGFWRYSAEQAKERKAAAAAAFQAELRRATDLLTVEPGLLVLSAAPARDGRWEIVCLKDDLAPDPEEFLREKGLDAKAFLLHVRRQISYDPDIVRQRIARKIRPPSSVEMSFSDDGTLLLSGHAPMGWIMRAKEEILALPGVRQVDMEDLSDPRMELLQDLAGKVEAITVEFPLGKDTPVPEALPKLDRAVDLLSSVERLAREVGMSVTVTVYGHADTLGSEKRNYEISQSRARTLAAMLYARGSSMPVVLYGMGAEFAGRAGDPPASHQASRRIEFRVNLTWTARPVQEVFAK